MQISIDASDFQRVADKFGERSDKMRNVIDSVIKKSVLVVQRYAKFYSPVKTGRMRASIGGGSFQGGSYGPQEGIEYGQMEASIGPTVYYAKYVHRKIPFMYAAAESSIPDIEKLVEEEVSKAIE